jgi:mannose-1-phosphate guanylyltransferase
MKPSNSERAALERTYAVILAGGSGTRFWPLSRRQRPKQLLELFGHGTLLQQTLARLRGIIPPKRTYIFTNERLRSDIARQAPQVPPAQIVAEPAARNTAPTLGLAAHEILRRDPGGLLVALPSDHVIRKPARFRSALAAACRLATVEGRTVLIGIEPTCAHTGYGYLHKADAEFAVDGERAVPIPTFHEKPKPDVAQRYFESGEYLWNGGMFVWRASTLLSNFARFQPKMAAQLEGIARRGGARNPAALKRLFPRLEKISIDYALMHETGITEVYAIIGDLGWSDVGSWSVLYELRPKDSAGNAMPKRSLCLESSGNLVVADKKYVVAVGVQDLVVVDTEDALLICTRQDAQKVGEAVKTLEQRRLTKLL